MVAIEAYAVAALTATLLFGGAVTASAVRAYRRTNATALGVLAVGLGLVTAGIAVGGAASVFSFPETLGVAVEATLTAVGFLVVAYSLRARGATRGV
jgi:hypothetical protein